MPTPTKTLVDLERKFWQSMVSQNVDASLELLHEPALVVSSHGAMKFNHAGDRKMAEQGSMVVTSFELSNVEVVFPNDTTAILTYRVKQGMKTRGQSGNTVEEMNDSSTWIQTAKRWQCVMHTETPVQPEGAVH